MDRVETLTLDVPYDGQSSVAGKGFALDQFGRAQGFHSFAEWAVVQFRTGRSITGSVVKSDDLDIPSASDVERTRTTFGYEVTIWVTPSDDE